MLLVEVQAMSKRIIWKTKVSSNSVFLTVLNANSLLCILTTFPSAYTNQHLNTVIFKWVDF